MEGKENELGGEKTGWLGINTGRDKGSVPERGEM